MRQGWTQKLVLAAITLAWQSGLKPIRNHLIELVLSGIVPLSEVPATLSIEQMAPHVYDEDRPNAL